MDVSKYQFSDDEIIKLNEYRDLQSDVRLKVRFIALIMLAEGIEPHKVVSILGKSLKTIKNWLHQYLTKGIASLNSFQYKPKQSFLSSEQTAEIIDWVKDNNPGKIKEVQKYITDQFKINYSHEAVRKMLRNNGLKFIRPKVIPGNPPSEAKQKESVERYFQLKAESPQGTAFLFGDGMHLVHQNIPGLCWGDPKNVPILKTNTGRQRLNILGAYNPVSHSFVHLTGEKNCDANKVVEFLELILKSYKQAPKIILFLDNATYFKARIVTEWLKKHPEIRLEFLPPYSPNLNLIERFWRFVKDKLVKNKYYEKYKTFRANVFRLLNHTDQYINEFKSLMVEKFEIVKKQA